MYISHIILTKTLTQARARIKIVNQCIVGTDHIKSRMAVFTALKAGTINYSLS